MRLLYGSTREEELRRAGWTPEQKAAFLDHRFWAQILAGELRRHQPGRHRAPRPAPSGGPHVSRWPEEGRIVDAALMAEYRAEGVGMRLIRGLFAEGSASGRGASIHAEVFKTPRGGCTSGWASSIARRTACICSWRVTRWWRMSDAFTIERFLPHVGEVFHVVTGDSQVTAVLLSEISRLATEGSKRRTREPFSLVFHAVPGSRLEQGIYRIEKPGMEPFECFLVPIGPDANGERIEAIYT